MKALITGASSGIGREMAKYLSSLGYDLVLVSRRKRKLQELKKELDTDIKIIKMDISSTFNCMDLHEQVKEDNIDMLINCAGFGVYGKFSRVKLDKELDLIDTNIKATHTLTKLFLQDFKKKGEGYILNVASLAAYTPGPLMPAYYASKSYVLSLTEAIYEELRREGSDIYIGALCPGPVDTEFNKVSNAVFNMRSMQADEVAKYAIDKMLKGKMIIVPGFKTKMLIFVSRFLSEKTKLKLAYNSQRKDR